MSKLLLLSAKLVVYLLCSLYLLPETEGSTSTCDPQSCRTFKELECCLVSDDDNQIALSLAFFPVQANPPEFVTVTYNFGTEQQVWYWSSRTSNFIHPFEVLQFLSLFFNKPEPYYTGAVDVNLPSACAAAGRLTHVASQTKLNEGDTVPNLQLLTQRLKLYAESGSGNIALSDTYTAKAYNNDALQELYKSEHKQISKIIITMAVFVVLFSVIIIVLMLSVFFCSTSHTQSEWFEKVQGNKPAVLSFAVLSLILNLFILSLDGAAIGFWIHKVEEDFFHKESNLGPISTVLAVDIAGIIWWLIIVIIAGFVKRHRIWTCTYDCFSYEPFYKHEFTQRHAPIILSLTLLSPIFCIIAHSPYIAIAYLNDGSHASSIFIYYTVLVYVFYGVMWLFFHWCEHDSKKTSDTDVENQKTSAEKHDHKEETKKIFTCCVKKDNQENKTDAKQTEDSKSCCNRECCFNVLECMCCCYFWKWLWNKCNCCDIHIKSDCPTAECKCQRYQGVIMTFLGATLAFLLGLVVTATCYFVFIPINRSISDAPGRILSIYESGGFLIGSFIVYKVIRYFYSKKQEEKKVKVVLDGTIKDIKVQLLGINDSTATKKASSGTTSDTTPTYKVTSITTERKLVKSKVRAHTVSIPTSAAKANNEDDSAKDKPHADTCSVSIPISEAAKANIDVTSTDDICNLFGVERPRCQNERLNTTAGTSREESQA